MGTFKRQTMIMIRLWSRFVIMSEQRLTSKIFNRDIMYGHPWFSEVKSLFDMIFLFQNRLQSNIHDAVIMNANLNYVCLMKNKYSVEPYVKQNFFQKSQICSGRLPLAKETAGLLFSLKRKCVVCYLFLVRLRLIDDLRSTLF